MIFKSLGEITQKSQCCLVEISRVNSCLRLHVQMFSVLCHACIREIVIVAVFCLDSVDDWLCWVNILTASQLPRVFLWTSTNAAICFVLREPSFDTFGMFIFWSWFISFLPNTPVLWDSFSMQCIMGFAVILKNHSWTFVPALMKHGKKNP